VHSLARSFVVAKRGLSQSTIIVDSSLNEDRVLGQWMLRKVKELFGVELRLGASTEFQSGTGSIFLGTLERSTIISQLLENNRILIGPNSRESQQFTFDVNSTSLARNRWDIASASSLRRDFLCHKDLLAQDFIAFSPDNQTLVLAGGSAQGTMYAAQTFLNRLFWERDRLLIDNLHTTTFPILNRPRFLVRGVCTNLGGPDHLSQNQFEKEWGGPDGYKYADFIDWLVMHRVNHLNIWLFELQFGICYPSRRFPECVNPFHPNVKREFVTKMIDYAHERHIEVSMFIDFPDMFAGVIRKHPELAAFQCDISRFPPEKDWLLYQKTGRNPKGHNYRQDFGTVCASKPEVMAFWEQYLNEVFTLYPNLDGIIGQFAEKLDFICQCESCQSNFLDLQEKYFRMMAQIAQNGRRERKLINCASPGDVSIMLHHDRYKNFVHMDWDIQCFTHERGRAIPHGQWFLFHRSGEKWTEYSWNKVAQVMGRTGLTGLFKRTVSYKSREADHSAFSEFSWNPELSIREYASLFTKFILRKEDELTAQVCYHWIQACGIREILELQDYCRANTLPFPFRDGDDRYPNQLRNHLRSISNLLKKASRRNAIIREIEANYREVYHRPYGGMRMYR
jgi:hypothetical protein